MFYRSLCAAGAVAAAVAVSTSALAAAGSVTGDVHMRTGPSTRYQVITTIPAGAPVNVFGCQSWCQVEFRGRQGYVSGNYVSTGYAQYQQAPRVIVRPAPWVYYDRGYDYRYRDRYHSRHHRHGGPGVGFYFGFGN